MAAIAGDYRSYHEQVDIAEAVRRAFSNFANFSGRANRGEFWWFVVANIVANVILTVVDSTILGFPILSLIWALVALIPGLSLSVRRLHDVDKSGWNILWGLVPVVGIVLLLIWYAKQGEPRPNRFG
jgi:uncharacterized membrane protein YhaH (DUF805 family)